MDISLEERVSKRDGIGKVELGVFVYLEACATLSISCLFATAKLFMSLLPASIISSARHSSMDRGLFTAACLAPSAR